MYTGISARETKKSKEISPVGHILGIQGWAEFLTRCKNIIDMRGNCSVGTLACFYRQPLFTGCHLLCLYTTLVNTISYIDLKCITSPQKTVFMFSAVMNNKELLLHMLLGEIKSNWMMYRFNVMLKS